MSATPVSTPLADAATEPASAPSASPGGERRPHLRVRRLVRASGLALGLGLLLLLARGHEDHPRNGPALAHAPDRPSSFARGHHAPEERAPDDVSALGHAEVLTATVAAGTLVVEVRVDLPQAGTYFAFAELDGPCPSSSEQSFSRRRWFASEPGPRTVHLTFAANKKCIGDFISQSASKLFLANFSVKNVDRHPSRTIVAFSTLAIPRRLFIESAPERARDEAAPAHKSLTGSAPQI